MSDIFFERANLKGFMVGLSGICAFIDEIAMNNSKDLKNKDIMAFCDTS
jgi:hypothetical protein